MDSAQGAVQQYEYSATFPLLLNISGQPTYFIALKDDSSLVKMYAMVNVQQYQIVATGTSAVNCASNYETLLAENGIISDYDGSVSKGKEVVTGRIEEIRTAVISGNTIYYLQLDSSDVFYSISASVAQQVVVLDVGDRVEITYSPGDGEILAASRVTEK
ncbi:MAG: hypothetical protein EOM14_14145 [Clostridia bacterium]|nr:hypothetical protein [Clostridia bacterium]